MNASDKATQAAVAAPFDFKSLFHDRYDRIMRVVARVVQDPARAEEIAVEAFWKLWRSPNAQGRASAGLAYRTAVRLALDELRGHARRVRSETKASAASDALPNPEQVHADDEERGRVRQTLATLDSRASELLLLRSHGLSYSEVAAAPI